MLPKKKPLSDTLKQDYIPPENCIEAKSFHSVPAINQVNSENHKFLQHIINTSNNTLEGVQGQMQIQFENDQNTYVGSGTLCIFGQGFKSNKYFLLTCAHNLVDLSENHQTIKYANKITYYYSRRNYKTYFCRLLAENFVLHPGYFFNNKMDDGFDLSLVKLTKQQIMKDAPVSTNSFWGIPLEESGATQGSVIKIIGYPSSASGELYSIDGIIKEINFHDDGQALILYDILSACPGQDGSPVYLKMGDNHWTIVGVHLGYSLTKNSFIGTGLTKNIHKWINKQQQIL
ncbi:unnamed protein product [Paramecium primaurelia]|uniref:Uncharacterized protein n=1 Tax=Paramecium primaurelia TaxID=5886 RepID=A0A8S1QIM7_PARPR|nr:unnamed protein product [Paramecium primaurelia]